MNNTVHLRPLVYVWDNTFKPLACWVTLKINNAQDLEYQYAFSQGMFNAGESYNGPRY